MRVRVLSWDVTDLRIGSEELTARAWDVAVLEGVIGTSLADTLRCEERSVPPAGSPRRLLPRSLAHPAAILARNDRIVSHRVAGLRRRGWLHAVQLACGVWVAAAPRAFPEPDRLMALVVGWAGGAPVVLAHRQLFLSGLSCELVDSDPRPDPAPVTFQLRARL